MEPNISHNTQLILIGGTLSASKNEQGYFAPSSTSLNDSLTSAGFNVSTAVRPFTIDSIDFDMQEHYPLLLANAIDALQQGRTPVICGGTDTLAWYSTLLTKDLMRQGFLQKDSQQKVIFLSSMHSIDEAPEHVNHILNTGKIVSEQPLSGGFAICAENKTADRFSIHDVTNQFEKISGSLNYAFRSKKPAAYILEDRFYLNQKYQAPQPFTQSVNKEYLRIAPPLLAGNESEAMLTYMQAIAASSPAFDGILIEGLPLGAMLKKQPLVDMIRQLKNQGIRTVFCNPVRFEDDYTHDGAGMYPWVDGKKAHLQPELIEAGAELITALPKDAYIEMMLGNQATPHYANTRLEPLKPTTLAELGIRYVPDSTIMKATIDGVANMTNCMVFSALPNGVLPDSLAPTLQHHSQNTQFQSTFEYNGSQFITPQGEVIIEGKANVYQAGQKTARFVTPYPGQFNMPELAASYYL